MPVSDLEHALQLHRAGRLAEAERIYRSVLDRQPHHPAALHLLGVLLTETGRPALGAELIGRAIAIKPDHAQAHTDLGNALHAAGRPDDTVAAYREALRLQPGAIDTHLNFGRLLLDLGRTEEAAEAYREVIHLNPLLPAAQAHLGIALQLGGRLDGAIAAYREALRIEATDGAVHYNLARALHSRSRLEEAVAAYRDAARLLPDQAEIRTNLGNALQALGRFDDAIAAYRQALALQPQSADAWNNLGNAAAAKGLPDEAIAAFRQALLYDPDHAAAWHNLGNAYKDQGQIERAAEACRKAVSLAPASAEMHSNLIYTLCFDPACEAAELLAEVLRWDRLHAQPLRGSLLPPRERRPQRRLRVGYVSPDFRDHSVGRNVLPLIREHDREQFEIFCYSDVATPDALTVQFQAYAAQWRSIAGHGHEEVAAMIRADGIDVLVDLTLHMAGNRLLVFARKPAPVQVTFAGYPGGTGLEAMDYRLSDPHLDPPGVSDRDYREKTIRLPHSFWCYDPAAMNFGLSSEPEVSALPVLDSGVVTFGSLVNFGKVNREVLRLWAEVLKNVAGSRLLLLAPEGSHRATTLELLRRDRISPNRVEFASRQPREAYLRLYDRIDIGLDTFPYNGHTTSLDALWMGVPVVTLVGKTAVGRAGVSQLTNLGLTEFIAHSHEEFVKIATSLAADRQRLAELRAGLRSRIRNSPLGDAAGFTRSVEDAYRNMWNEGCTRGSI